MWADIADGMSLENYPESAEKMTQYQKVKYLFIFYYSYEDAMNLY